MCSQNAIFNRMMSDDRFDGLLLAALAVIIFAILVMLDKRYLNGRVAHYFTRSKFRVLFMILVFITVMFSSIYWQTYIRL